MRRLALALIVLGLTACQSAPAPKLASQPGITGSIAYNNEPASVPAPVIVQEIRVTATRANLQLQDCLGPVCTLCPTGSDCVTVVKSYPVGPAAPNRSIDHAAIPAYVSYADFWPK